MGESAKRLQSVSGDEQEQKPERKPRARRSDDDKLREILHQKQERVEKLRKQLGDARTRVTELEQRLAVEEPALQQLVGMVGERPEPENAV